MSRKINIFNSLDWLTITIYFILIFLGWINIYSAAYNEEHSNIFDISQRYGKQMMWIGAAIFVIIIIIIIDSKFYSFFAYGIYGFAIFLLIAVLFLGKEVNSAKSWFEFGAFKFQPAEFAKFATALAIAKYLSSQNIKDTNIFWILFSAVLLPVGIVLRILRKGKTTFVPIVVLLLLPAGLILLQNDAGSALIYISFIILLYREGLSSLFILICLLMAILFVSVLITNVSTIIFVIIGVALLIHWIISNKAKETGFALGILTVIFGALWGLNEILKTKIEIGFLTTFAVIISSVIFVIYAYRHKIFHAYFIISVVIGAIFITNSVNFVFNNILEEHQKNRIEVTLGLKSDLLGDGYNLNQSKIAIGSGGLTGKGFLNGTQTKFNFVPEQTTDFIFCTVGEEWGFAGTLTIILIFLMLLLRLIFLAERQRSKFSRIYGYGVISILFFHLAINIGMTIGLAPVIGIPLPFFSYGGSSLWSFTILLFIFLRLDASRMELMK